MKLFVSWSGTLSRRIAEALREWLPNVLQAIDPWMSAEDIEKGARWSSDIASELDKTKAGILCITPDNLEAPWLNFEAGALSKTIDKTFVSPYLFGLRPSDLKGPLVQFQSTEANKKDTRRLLGTLNRALGEAALPEKQLDKTFEIWWPELESSLQRLQSVKAPDRPQRSERELLEEILALVRDQAKRTPLEDLNISSAVGQDEPVVIVRPGSGDSATILRSILGERYFVRSENPRPKPAEVADAVEKPELAATNQRKKK
jgi:hypothetical protein